MGSLRQAGGGPRRRAVAFAAALTLVCALAAVLPAAGSTQAAASFVTRAGSQLLLDGKPYRFTGINIYNANNASGCWYALASGSGLDDSLGAIGGGSKVIRAWFFQALATSGGGRDWSGIDHTLSVAAAHGARVIVTLGNQWKDCDGPAGGAGSFKDEAWYTGGYTQPDPAGTESYRDWVAEIVARYKDDPTILAWQLMNEAEVKPSESSGSCSVDAEGILKAFAADVSGLIRSTDSDHLISLGTIGGGQCGAQSDEYQDLHDIPTIDLCEYHDYGSPTVPMPGDQWNGLQRRLDQCNALNKPLFVGETGIRPSDISQNSQPNFPLWTRANAFEAKFRAQFGAGVAGELVWAWDAQGSKEDDYDIGPGDPTLRTLTVWNSPSGGTTQRVSVPAGGGEANNRSVVPYVTPDGRYVLFSSEATNLSLDDTFANPSCAAVDVFLKDRQTGSVELVDVDSSEQQLRGFCGSVGDGISADGRYVLFESDAYRSTPSQYVGSDVLVRDRVAGTTRNLTAGANGRSGNAMITPDGRYVLFGSEASNIVSGTPSCPFHWRQYLYDLRTTTVELVSVGSSGTDGCNSNGANLGEVSADGRFVVFQTDDDLVPEDAGNVRDLDVYLRDRQAATTTPVSVDTAATPTQGFDPRISADGSTIAYDSTSSSIVDGDDNALGGLQQGSDVFTYDRVSHATQRVSVDSSGHEFEFAFWPSLSARGRFVTFIAGHVMSRDPANHLDVYVHDRQTGTTERIGSTSGLPGGGIAQGARLSLGGGFVVFQSTGSTYASGDTNNTEDVFVHARSGPVEPPFPVTSDSDGDGVVDAIDTGNGAFSDGSTTGSIVDRAGLTVLVTDAPAPDGVRMTVAGSGTARAVFTVCGFSTLRLGPGSDVTITCGSVKVQVAAGSAELVLGGGQTVVSVPAGVTARVTDTGGGTYKVEDLGGGPVTVTVGGVVTTVPAGGSTSAATWRFVGFEAPVANPPALTAVAAGDPVPLKWQLLRQDGSAVTGLKSVAGLAVTQIDCTTKAAIASPIAVSPVPKLDDKTKGRYQLTWTTAKSWAKTCRALALDVGQGIRQQAYFRFS